MKDHRPLEEVEEEMPPEVLVPAPLTDKEKGAFMLQEKFVLDFKTNKIMVFLRIRPLSPGELSEPDRRKRSYKANGNILALRGSKYGWVSYKFNQIFAETARNKDVFEQVKGLVEEAVKGFNCSIFAYGETGSGKTHSLQGSEREDGIAQLSFEYLYKLVQEQSAKFNFKISVTMIQIYYTDLDDLLAEFRSKPISVELDENQLVRFKNAVKFKCVNFAAKGPAELQEKYEYGKWQRTMRSTDENEQSSRSHLILTITIAKTPKNPALDQPSTGKLSFLDLAGSESV